MYSEGPAHKGTIRLLLAGFLLVATTAAMKLERLHLAPPSAAAETREPLREVRDDVLREPAARLGLGAAASLRSTDGGAGLRTAAAASSASANRGFAAARLDAASVAFIAE